MAFRLSAELLPRALSTLRLRNRQAEEACLRRRTDGAFARPVNTSESVTAGIPGVDGATIGTAVANVIAADDSSGTSTPTTLASGTLGDHAPEVKLTKKERERFAKASGDVKEQQTRNETWLYTDCVSEGQCQSILRRWRPGFSRCGQSTYSTKHIQAQNPASPTSSPASATTLAPAPLPP